MKFRKVKLKEVCTVNQGLQIPISKRFREKAPNRYFYITIQFLKGNVEEYYIENPKESVICTKEDILVVRTGSTGNVLTNVEGCFHNNFFKVVPNEKIYRKYLYYTLNNNYMYKKMLNVASGTTIPDLKHSSFYDLEIFLPPLEVQYKIATILSNIDKKIELNNQINNNLYKIVSQLYQNLFDYGEWEEIELKDIANVFSGKRPKEKLDEGVYPIVGANGIVGFTSDYNLDNDIIITGRVGTLGIVKRHYRKVWASDNTLIIKTKYNNFVENYLKTVDYSSLNRGSTQPLLSQSDLKSQKMLFNKEIVESFELRVKKKIEKIRNNDEENEVLEKLRDTLLPKLMNGKIDIENIRI